MMGFTFNGISSGIKGEGVRDLGMIFSEKPASAAALFTRNRVAAAPVVMGRERVRQGICQAVLVNSGNANCCTGGQGLKDAVDSSKLAAAALNIPDEFVMVSSTGVIGAPLPMDKIETGIAPLVKGLGPDGIADFADAILTTDTCRKVAERTCRLGGREFSIVGMAKGSGMIMPDMATMLVFVCTDLNISAPFLQAILQKACDRSFNRICVDGDTSTNDTVLCLANGMSDAVVENDRDLAEVQEMFNTLFYRLARKIVKDGEGATKTATIRVKGTRTPEDALRAARTVADSNLVKTALFGEDPNWGRILAAAGRSGAAFDADKADLFFGKIKLFEKGAWCGKEAEAAARRQMKAQEVDITLDFNDGPYTDYYMFCDFSEAYVTINAEYRS